MNICTGTEVWYRGYDSRHANYGVQEGFGMWVSDNPEYAKEYADEYGPYGKMIKVTINFENIDYMTEVDLYDANYDPYESDQEVAEYVASQGANAWLCDYYDHDAQGLCLIDWKNNPGIVSIEDFQMTMNEEKEEITYYRFLSEVRAFLSKLMSRPIDAKPSKYLEDRGVTKEKLIRDLRNKGVLERHEKILDSTNSDKKKATYTVKYKVRKKNFEERIHWLYAKYFEKNVNESVKEMQSWHGSMNSFDAFDENHVDDGAGAQLKGWGTYVATDRATGEHYCQRFGNNRQTYLYEVDIPDDNGNNYLNFSGNRPEVYDWIYKVLVREYPKCKFYLKARIKTCKERDNLEGITYPMPGLMADEISKTLDRNGVMGIRYPNDNGGMNYCVFRASNVRIVNRNQYGMNESVFENEDSLIDRILNDPQLGETYRKRGGVPRRMNEEAGGGGAGAGGAVGGGGNAGGGSFVDAGNVGNQNGVTSTFSTGSYNNITVPLVTTDTKKKKKKDIPETTVLRRKLGTRRDEGVTRRNLIVTEAQFRRILEATATSIGMSNDPGQNNEYEYTVPFSVDKDDPTVSPEGRKGGFSMQRIPNNDPKPTNESKKKLRKNDEGEIVPEECDKCGGKVVVQIHGEPVFVCSKCGKYFGTMPCTLNEAYLGDLYHYTTLSHLYGMLQDDCIYANEDEYGHTDSRMGRDMNVVCLTRNKNYNLGKSESTAVRITLDGSLMSSSLRGAKIHPYNYYEEGSDPIVPQEAEERVYGSNIYPLSKYCKAIDIWVNEYAVDFDFCDDIDVAYDALYDEGNEEPTDEDVIKWFVNHIMTDFPKFRNIIHVH